MSLLSLQVFFYLQGSESNHLVGKGNSSTTPRDHYTVTQWITNNKAGSISFHESQGKIQVKISGYYYVYGQMNNDNDNDNVRRAGHTTYMRNKMVMRSWASKGRTTYHAGVFHIEKNDTLLVKIPIKRTTIMLDQKASYFGAFLLQAITTPLMIRTGIKERNLILPLRN